MTKRQAASRHRRSRAGEPGYRVSMNRRTLTLALIALPTLARAHSSKLGDIAIGHAWALPSQQTDGQVFFPLVNNGKAADALVAARSNVCTLIELRRNNRYDDPPLASMPLDPGKPVAMRPTARHLRLIGLISAARRGPPLHHHPRFPQRRRSRDRGHRRKGSRRLTGSLAVTHRSPSRISWPAPCTASR